MSEEHRAEFLAEAYRVWSAAHYLGAVADGFLVRWINRRLARAYARRIEILTAKGKHR